MNNLHRLPIAAQILALLLLYAEPPSVQTQCGFHSTNKPNHNLFKIEKIAPRILDSAMNKHVPRKGE
jgi:hypothetical protein